MKVLSYLLIFFTLGISAQHSEKKFSLYYENDQFELTPAHFVLIDSLKSISNKSLYDIHIKGYTNSVGEVRVDQDMSFA